jgi:hypothetical protein
MVNEARSVIEDAEVLGTTVENAVARANWHPAFFYTPAVTSVFFSLDLVPAICSVALCWREFALIRERGGV